MTTVEDLKNAVRHRLVDNEGNRVATDKGEGIFKSTEGGLRSEIFWDGLQGLLAQRLEAETGAKRLRASFEIVWSAR